MKITYDKENNVGYIELVPIGPGEVKRTMRLLALGANLDIDADGHLVGIELLDADRLLHPLLKALVP